MPKEVERRFARAMKDYIDYLNRKEREILYEDFPDRIRRKPKRKLSAWQKFVKNKRNHIKYRDGKLNLKKMAVAFRRKKRR
jgi:hypothetical protein